MPEANDSVVSILMNEADSSTDDCSRSRGKVFHEGRGEEPSRKNLSIANSRPKNFSVVHRE